MSDCTSPQSNFFHQGETTHLRRKEGSVDYRFCPEPDLPPLLITNEHVEALKATLPELPEATMARFCRYYELPEHLSRLIVCAAGGASGNCTLVSRLSTRLSVQF